MTFAKSLQVICVFPNLAIADGITLDAETLTRIAGQGAVYVRSLVPLESEDEGETEEELQKSVLDSSAR